MGAYSGRVVSSSKNPYEALELQGRNPIEKAKLMKGDIEGNLSRALIKLDIQRPMWVYSLSKQTTKGIKWWKWKSCRLSTTPMQKLRYLSVTVAREVIRAVDRDLG
jgi:hypothetical protein